MKLEVPKEIWPWPGNPRQPREQEQSCRQMEERRGVRRGMGIITKETSSSHQREEERDGTGEGAVQKHQGRMRRHQNITYGAGEYFAP